MKTHIPMSVMMALVTACAETSAPTATPEYARFSADAYELIDIGTFNGDDVQAFEMTDHGVVYGRWGTFPGPNGSFRWTEKRGFEDLGGLGGQPFLILAKNKHDDVAGSIPTGLPPSPIRAAVKLRGDAFLYIDDAAHFGNAWGINKHRVVVGARQTQPPSPQHAFIWSERDGLSVLPLEFPTGTPVSSSASRINDRGLVAGLLIYRPSDSPIQRQLPFLWDATIGTRTLPTLSQGNVAVTWLTESEFVSGAAETRVPLLGERRLFNPLSVQSQVSDVPIHAWRWSAARGLEDLGTLGGKHSVTWGTDEEGNAFGWADDASGARVPVKWPIDGGIIRLPSLGGHGIAEPPNKHGIAAGYVVAPDGKRHGALWVPIK